MKILKILGVIIIALFIISMCRQSTIMKNQNDIISNQTEIIEHHLFQDSLYRDHLSTCSFISRDEITFDKNGYAKLIGKWDLWKYN